ncbi:RNA polymerase sigma factor [Myxosarcina sp. GI1]|uniref:RNA polymerase sigma factor n=1 Tax=Myxosarcina sp. GI1 TaxID=1541065 RepID=UPI000564422F|nr:sigma-70 family RNA polymerase sigma factor [Myxosarcina sp. GI1]
MTNPPLTPNNKQEQLELLAKIVNDTLSEEWDESTRKIFFFIKRSLRQFKLDGQLQESDILLDSYLRVRKKIESGESIQNMPAYLNRVAFNIIREKSKKQKKSEDLHIRLINNEHGHPDTTSETDGSDSYQITSLLKALEELKSEDFELIQLRIVKGLSWNEISDYLNSSQDNENQKKLSTRTLRKRGERALKRLREAYFSVEEIYILGAGVK